MKRTSSADDPLRDVGKSLHDDVAPLLAGAGLQLQILRMDHPETAPQITEILVTLEAAMDRIRALSQQLSPSPFTPVDT
jgi:signal transduction histidine kinase